jgi:hypothetical protein
MTEFTFQVTLLASIRVKAKTQAEAELKLRTALEGSDANLGMLDDAPIVVPVEIEGDLDLIESASEELLIPGEAAPLFRDNAAPL